MTRGRRGKLGIYNGKYRVSKVNTHHENTVVAFCNLLLDFLVFQAGGCGIVAVADSFQIDEILNCKELN